MRLALCILYIPVIGLLSQFIGVRLPRSWFHPKRFPYAAWKWEKQGKIYNKTYVYKWKDALPDMSRISRRMVRKSITPAQFTPEHVDRLVVETCVAEMVHLILMLLSPVIYWINPTCLGAVIAIAYALSHVPFIIIQRYNRPTLVTLSKRLKEREERIKHAHPDPVR